MQPQDPILEFPLEHSDELDVLTLGDIFKGVMILGGTGSGKTSGSGHTLADAFLYHGFGGLILIVKPEEKVMWLSWAKARGREQDIIVVSSQTKNRFNFLDYVGKPGPETNQQIYFVLYEITQVLGRKKAGDPFWTDAGKILVVNALNILTVTHKGHSVGKLLDLIQTAPESVQEAQDIQQDPSFFGQCIRFARKRLKAKPQLNQSPIGRSYHRAEAYFLNDWAKMSGGQRSGVKGTVSNLLNEFVQPLMQDF